MLKPYFQAAVFLIAAAGCGVFAQGSGCKNARWLCWGQTPTGNAFSITGRGPESYLDNQDAVLTRGGIIRKVEYQATHTGTEVRFMFLERQQQDEPHKYHILSDQTHTAQQTGFQSVEVNVAVPAGTRIAFEINSGSVNPIPYEIGFENGAVYDSQMGYTTDGSDNVRFPPRIFNRRYQFRVCMQTQPENCPTPLPIDECMTTMTNVGCFGQGVPRQDGSAFQKGPYSMIDIDGSAQLITGVIAKVEYRPWKVARFYFQVWRPEDVEGGRMKLLQSFDIMPRAVDQVIEITDQIIPVQDKDRWGFSYGESFNVPIKYSRTTNIPNNEPYNALECRGCALNTLEGGIVNFPMEKVQKQFRIRVCIATISKDCPSEPPPTTVVPEEICTAVACQERMSTQSRLRADLLCDTHDKESIPVPQYSDTLTVRLGLMLRWLTFDKEHSALQVSAKMSETWMDYGLKWCPDVYDDISEIRVTGSDIWTPDLTPRGMMTMDSARCDKASLMSDGQVNRPLVISFYMHCSRVVATNTYETYNCMERFASWMYDQSKLMLESSGLDRGTMLRGDGVEVLSASLGPNSDVVDDRSSLQMSIRIRVMKKPESKERDENE